MILKWSWILVQLNSFKAHDEAVLLVDWYPPSQYGISIPRALALALAECLLPHSGIQECTIALSNKTSPEPRGEPGAPVWTDGTTLGPLMIYLRDHCHVICSHKNMIVSEDWKELL